MTVATATANRNGMEEICPLCNGTGFTGFGDRTQECQFCAPLMPLASPTISLPPPKRKRLIEADSATRKQYPMATGLLDYFPDALAEVSKLSYLGNLKHNPGQPLHHSRGKSTDHPDCIIRHMVERGGFEDIVINGVTHRQRHSASLVWRALALLQEELEQENDLPLPRGASFD